MISVGFVVSDSYENSITREKELAKGSGQQYLGFQSDALEISTCQMKWNKMTLEKPGAKKQNCKKGFDLQCGGNFGASNSSA